MALVVIKSFSWVHHQVVIFIFCCAIKLTQPGYPRKQARLNEVQIKAHNFHWDYFIAQQNINTTTNRSLWFNAGEGVHPPPKKKYNCEIESNWSISWLLSPNCPHLISECIQFQVSFEFYNWNFGLEIIIVKHYGL